jgi:prepilin-type N-terminal cleavage/methylation domain-containing protein
MNQARGFTLLEVVVSSSVLLMLTFTQAYSFMPLQRATTKAGQGMDMDRIARHALDSTRRELRTSGSMQDGTSLLEVTDDAGVGVATGVAGTRIAFRRRLGPDETLNSSTGWSTEIVYARVNDGVFDQIAGTPTRYRLERTQSDVNGGAPVVLAAEISTLTFTQVSGSDTVIVDLELTRSDSNWTAASLPPAVTRVYQDQVELLNPRF